MITILDVTPARRDGGRLRAFQLEQPRRGTRIESASLPISGWVLGEKSRVTSVELVSHDEVIARSKLDIERPRLVKRFSDALEAGIAGFRLEVRAQGEGDEVLLLRGLLEDGRRAPIARISAQVSQPGLRFKPLRWHSAPEPRAPDTPRVPAPHKVEDSRIAPDRIVWIFGAGRSGTTWLASMMAELRDHEMWDEPLVGALFGDFYEKYNGEQRGHNFILGPPIREVWLPAIRDMVLSGAAGRFPTLSKDGYVVIKEPHGSQGAALLSQALPGSRVILVIRDPRDVLASMLDANRTGSWTERTRGRRRRSSQVSDAQTDPDAFIREKTRYYLRIVLLAKGAYESHRGPKALLRYEDLRRDTLGVMLSMYSELDIPIDRDELVRAAEGHAWENVPAEKKGSGHFYRKGMPGGWRDDLTPTQVRIVEEDARPILDEFYGDEAPTR
jgi:hypothetical protein